MEKYSLLVKDNFYIGDISFALSESSFARWEKANLADGFYLKAETAFAVFNVVNDNIEIPSNTGYNFYVMNANIGIVADPISNDTSVETIAELNETGMLIEDYAGLVMLIKEDNGNITVTWEDNIVHLYVTDVPEDLEIHDIPLIESIRPIPGTDFMAVSFNLDQLAPLLEESGLDLKDLTDTDASTVTEEHTLLLDNGNKLIFTMTA